MKILADGIVSDMLTTRTVQVEGRLLMSDADGKVWTITVSTDGRLVVRDANGVEAHNEQGMDVKRLADDIGLSLA